MVTEDPNDLGWPVHDAITIGLAYRLMRPHNNRSNYRVPRKHFPPPDAGQERLIFCISPKDHTAIWSHLSLIGEAQLGLAGASVSHNLLTQYLTTNRAGTRCQTHS
jgi:hypothetical protein